MAENNTEEEKPTRACTGAAFVCPGAGQFMQRRWIVGAFFSITFLTFLFLLVIEIFRPMFANLRIAIDMAATGSNEEFQMISLANILTYFGIALLTYFLNLADVMLAHKRALMAWRRKERGPAPGEPPDLPVG